MRTTLPVPLEKGVQYDVKRAYEAVGCFVANFSQARASKQTPGIPDFYVSPPLLRGAPWWHEVKRPKGKQSVQQRAWQQMCEVRHVAYVCGGVQEALEHLREIGVIR